MPKCAQKLPTNCFLQRAQVAKKKWEKKNPFKGFQVWLQIQIQIQNVPNSAKKKEKKRKVV